MGNTRRRLCRVGTAAALVAVALPSGTAAGGRAQLPGVADCFQLRPTIVGTPADDEIAGTPESDVILTLAGNDVVRGGGGFDFICTGEGDDVAFGGGAPDAIEVAQGVDAAFGGPGGDVMVEANIPEDDPSAGPPVSVGDASPDEFYGGPGDDLITEDGANDLVDGGAGRDTFVALFANAPAVIDLRTGYASSASRGDVNTLVSMENALGTLHPDTIIGSEEPNVLGGFGGADAISGEAASDLLLSSIDGAVLDGGSDNHRDGVMTTYNDPVDADLQAGVIARRSGEGAPDRLTGIDDVIATSGDDVITGSAGMNRLYGGGGDDVIDALAGDDVLVGDGPFWPWIERGHWDMQAGVEPVGEDDLDGGEGEDRIDGGPATDTCAGGEKVKRCERGGRAREGARAGRPGISSELRTWLRVLNPDAGRAWVRVLLVPARRLARSV